MKTLVALTAALLFTLVATSASAVTVFVDFTSDLHNGAAGPANGTADWIDELNQLTASVGVTTFTPAERSAIETDILSQLSTMYAGYSITFTTTSPGGTFDAIGMGAQLPPGTLGSAPVDIANLSSGQVADVAVANFGTILDEHTGVVARAAQMSELATALAGTAAHEVGHSMGLLHHHAYSDPSITPATYAATGGVQNDYIMGTGSTGISELERETLRTFSDWEQALFDVAGGAAAAPGLGGFDHQPLVGSPIVLNTSEEDSFDAGGTFGTASPMPAFATGASSGLSLSFFAGNLDAAGGGPADIDIYSFTSPGPGRFLAEVYSDNRFGGGFDFDTELILFNSVGAPLFSNDDIFYSGNTYNAVTFRENDSFLLNIPIPSPGTYFLRIAGSPAPSIAAATGDVYWILAGLQAAAPPVNIAIPEPSTLVLLGPLLVALNYHVRRRRR